MAPRVVQKGSGATRALVAGFLVDPIALARAVGPSACVVVDDPHGSATLAELVDLAHREAGFESAVVALVGYSAGCGRVRSLRVAGGSAGAYLLIDGTHASWPPASWQIAWLHDLAGEARAERVLLVASHTEQIYTESLTPPQTPFASTRTVLRLATGYALDTPGPLDAPGIQHDGALWVYSYQSAPIDAAAHAAQLARVLPQLAARHLAPWVADVAAGRTPAYGTSSSSSTSPPGSSSSSTPATPVPVKPRPRPAPTTPAPPSASDSSSSSTALVVGAAAAAAAWLWK